MTGRWGSLLLRSPRLLGILVFIEPENLVASATAVGLGLESRHTERLDSGKAFEVLRFLW